MLWSKIRLAARGGLILILASMSVGEALFFFLFFFFEKHFSELCRCVCVSQRSKTPRLDLFNLPPETVGSLSSRCDDVSSETEATLEVWILLRKDHKEGQQCPPSPRAARWLPEVASNKVQILDVFDNVIQLTTPYLFILLLRSTLHTNICTF